MTRSRKFVKGDVFIIKLEGANYCYGMALDFPLCIFFDFLGQENADIKEVIKSNILFAIWVSASARKRWRVLGNVPVPECLSINPAFFKVDLISNKLYIYQNEHERRATLAEAMGLEAAAVWDPEHVETRLSDQFAGRPNIWVEGMKSRLIESQ